MKVYIGADHRGFALKEKVKKWLNEWKYDYEDFGARILDPHDDYTLFAEKVGSVVAKEKGSRGLLLCGSGVGMGVTANKFDGIVAGLGKSIDQVQAGRRDDDMNILVIAAEYTSEEDSKDMIKKFLKTKFSGKARYKRRLEDIRRIEENN